jgi:hypothetical protein
MVWCGRACMQAGGGEVAAAIARLPELELEIRAGKKAAVTAKRAGDKAEASRQLKAFKLLEREKDRLEQLIAAAADATPGAGGVSSSKPSPIVVGAPQLRATTVQHLAPEDAVKLGQLSAMFEKCMAELEQPAPGGQVPEKRAGYMAKAEQLQQQMQALQAAPPPPAYEQVSTELEAAKAEAQRHMADGNRDAATAAMDRAEMLHAQQAQQQQAQQQTQQAVVAATPERISAYVRMAKAFMANSNPSGAASAVQQGLKLDPRDPTLRALQQQLSGAPAGAGGEPPPDYSAAAPAPAPKAAARERAQIAQLSAAEEREYKKLELQVREKERARERERERERGHTGPERAAHASVMRPCAHAASQLELIAARARSDMPARCGR